MVAPLQVFTSARAALEVTRGTDLTPTRIIYAQAFPWTQDFKTIRPETLTGSYEGFPSAAPGVETNTFGMQGRLSYEQAIWFGNLGFGPLASGSGGGADKTWDFGAVISNTSDNVKSATVQLGDAQAISASVPGVKLNFCMLSTLNLHWEKNDDGALTFDAAFSNASPATQITAFTGALSDTTQNLISCNNTQTYIDATTIGSTADSNVQSVDWTLDLGPVPFYGLNNSSSASAVYRPHHRNWTATIVRQYQNNNEWSIYQSKASRKIRINTVGAALGGSNYLFQVDLYGTYTGRTMTDTDGIITETLTLENVTDASLGRSYSAKVVNALSTIT